MSVQSDCLENIIGLSRTDCECFEVPSNTSDSGIYIDETEGLNLVQSNGAADCGNGSIWDMLQKAKVAAIGSYRTDISARLLQLYKPSRVPFKGIIGRTEKKVGDLTPKALAGLQVLCAPVKNGAIILKRIGLFFDTTTTMDVTIYNNISSDPVATFTGLNSVANKVSWNEIQQTTLPMYTTEADYLIYYVVYEYATAKPIKNELQCIGCSGKLLINYLQSNPNFSLKSNDSRYTWYNWVNVTGVTKDTVDEMREGNPPFTNLAYGLLLDGEIKCNANDISCNDTDYTNSPLALAMAYAIRYRAAELLCTAIINSTQLNRYTMLDREQLYGKRNQYRKEYSDRLDWIAENIDWANTGCLTCNRLMVMGSTL